MTGMPQDASSPINILEPIQADALPLVQAESTSTGVARSVGESAGESAGDSVGESVGDSVGDSAREVEAESDLEARILIPETGDTIDYFDSLEGKWPAPDEELPLLQRELGW